MKFGSSVNISIRKFSLRRVRIDIDVDQGIHAGYFDQFFPAHITLVLGQGQVVRTAEDDHRFSETISSFITVRRAA